MQEEPNGSNAERMLRTAVHNRNGFASGSWSQDRFYVSCIDGADSSSYRFRLIHIDTGAGRASINRVIGISVCFNVPRDKCRRHMKMLVHDSLPPSAT